MQFPSSVSLVSSSCFNATNNLKLVHHDRVHSLNKTTAAQKHSFAVCVKALDFSNATLQSRLIEWIETLRLLGAAKIFFYEYFVNNEIKKVLDYYERRENIGVTRITLPGELPNQAQMRQLYLKGKTIDKRLTELIQYNDCFYKNLYDYKYIAIMDTDEIIVPAEENTWTELIENIIKFDIKDESLTQNVELPITTFCFENFYFLDDMMDGKEDEVSHISPEFHMLRHIYRTNDSTKQRFMKCFHSTDHTLIVHNHFAISCRNGKKCNRHYVNETRAQMNHYRNTCVHNVIKNCSLYSRDTVKDTKLWRHKYEIMERVETVLNYLKYQ